MNPNLQNPGLLSDAAIKRIETAVAQAETKTSCEFVVVLAPASSRYEGPVLRAGAAVALIVYVALYWFLFFSSGRPDTIWLLVEACAAGAVGVYACSRVAPLKRMLTSHGTRSGLVSQAAGAVFFEQKVSYTSERNAALIYISVLEGEARLLPDIGLERKVGEARLNEVQARLVNCQEDGVAAVERAVSELGVLCAEPFPRATDDKNELPDRPIVRLP